MAGGLLVVAAGMAILSGCAHPEGRPSSGMLTAAAGSFSKEHLRNALDEFDDFFEVTIKHAADNIDQHQPDRQTKVATLMWRSRAISAADSALKQDDALRAFLDTWTLCVRLSQYFEEGSGRTLFGMQQPIAIATAKEIEAGIEEVGRMFLAEDALFRIRDGVREVARKQPIKGMFSDMRIRPAAVPAEETPPILGSLLALPLAPFQVFEGIDKGATAIHGFTTVASRFTDVVEEWPESISWQLQLMLLNLESYDTVRTVVTSLDRLSDSSASMAETAKKLPEEVRREAAHLLEEIDARQAGFQATLKQADQTAQTVERALQRVDEAANAIDRTARSVAEAGIAWNESARVIGQTVTDIGKCGQTAPPATRPSRPFDINDYNRTADSLTAAAVELRQLVAEFHGLAGSSELTTRLEEIDARIAGLTEHTSGQAASLANHVTWRLAQLLVLAFVLALLYRIVNARFSTRPPAQ